MRLALIILISTAQLWGAGQKIYCAVLSGSGDPDCAYTATGATAHQAVITQLLADQGSFTTTATATTGSYTATVASVANLVPGMTVTGSQVGQGALIIGIDPIGKVLTYSQPFGGNVTASTETFYPPFAAPQLIRLYGTFTGTLTTVKLAPTATAPLIITSSTPLTRCVSGSSCPVVNANGAANGFTIASNFTTVNGIEVTGVTGTGNNWGISCSSNYFGVSITNNYIHDTAGQSAIDTNGCGAYIAHNTLGANNSRGITGCGSSLIGSAVEVANNEITSATASTSNFLVKGNGNCNAHDNLAYNGSTSFASGFWSSANNDYLWRNVSYGQHYGVQSQAGTTTTTATASSGVTVIVVASAAGITPTQGVSGSGIQTGTIVVGPPSGTSVTISLATTAPLSSTSVTFSTQPGPDFSQNIAVNNTFQCHCEGGSTACYEQLHHNLCYAAGTGPEIRQNSGVTNSYAGVAVANISAPNGFVNAGDKNIFETHAGEFAASDWNDFWQVGTVANVGIIAGTGYATLSAWNVATQDSTIPQGLDAHTLQFSPRVTGNVDLINNSAQAFPSAATIEERSARIRANYAPTNIALKGRGVKCDWLGGSSFNCYPDHSDIGPVRIRSWDGPGGVGSAGVSY